MRYDHAVFKEVWQTVPASYPTLTNQHEKVTDLIHLVHRRLADKLPGENKIAPTINQSLNELKIFEGKKAFRAFAQTYFNELIGLIRGWNVRHTPPTQEELPLAIPLRRRGKAVEKT